MLFSEKSCRSSYGVLHILLQMQTRHRAFVKSSSFLLQGNATNLYKNMYVVCYCLYEKNTHLVWAGTAHSV